MPITVVDLLEKEIGVRAPFHRIDPVRTTIGLTALQFLRANPNRVAFSIYNISANVLFIRPDATPTTTSGFRVGPNTGLAFFFKEDLILPTLEWFGIFDVGAANNIFTLEMLSG